MQYDSCRDAIQASREACSKLSTREEREACAARMNVSDTKEGVVCEGEALRCNISGYSDPKYACVPKATLPQTVHGVHLNGGGRHFCKGK